MVLGVQRHAPASLPVEKSRYPLYRRLGGLQGWCGRVRKISLPPVFDSRTVQPVASRCTDCAIPAIFVISAWTKCTFFSSTNDLLAQSCISLTFGPLLFGIQPAHCARTYKNENSQEKADSVADLNNSEPEICLSDGYNLIPPLQRTQFACYREQPILKGSENAILYFALQGLWSYIL